MKTMNRAIFYAGIAQHINGDGVFPSFTCQVLNIFKLLKFFLIHITNQEAF